MGGRGMHASRGDGGRDRTSRPGTKTQAEQKKQLGPNYKVFSTAAAEGWEVASQHTTYNFQFLTYRHANGTRITAVINTDSGRIREAEVYRQSSGGGRTTLDDIGVGTGDRRARVIGFLKKYGGK